MSFILQVKYVSGWYIHARSVLSIKSSDTARTNRIVVVVFVPVLVVLVIRVGTSGFAIVSISIIISIGVDIIIDAINILSPGALLDLCHVVSVGTIVNNLRLSWTQIRMPMSMGRHNQEHTNYLIWKPIFMFTEIVILRFVYGRGVPRHNNTPV